MAQTQVAGAFLDGAELNYQLAVRGKTLTDLSGLTGLSVGWLAQLRAGKVRALPATVDRIWTALESVPLIPGAALIRRKQ